LLIFSSREAREPSPPEDHDLKDLMARERRETTGYEPFEREVGIPLAKRGMRDI